MHRTKYDVRKEQQIQKCTRGNSRSAEAISQKIKTINYDHDIEPKLSEAKYRENKSRRTESSYNIKYERPNISDKVVNYDVPKAFNSSVKDINGAQKEIQKSSQNNVNSNKNNFIDDDLELLIKSINEYFSKGNLDKAQIILNKAEELYIPDDIKAWRRKIQDAKLKIQIENDERRRQKLESLKSEEKKAFDYIGKAKEAIVSRDLVTTDKYLQDALDLITIPNENLSRNMKKNTEHNVIKRKLSNNLEKAIQTEAFKFTKKAEEAFFNHNFDEAEKLLLISERISPDEYVEEMIALIENAKQEGTSKEKIENLRKMFLIKQSDTEHDYEFNNLDFAETFKIANNFDKALELLKTTENLYSEKKAKEFFKRIQIATENQRRSNCYFYNNETTRNESNRDEAYQCLLKVKEAFLEGNIERAERLLKKSDRMYVTYEARHY